MHTHFLSHTYTRTRTLHASTERGSSALLGLFECELYRTLHLTYTLSYTSDINSLTHITSHIHSLTHIHTRCTQAQSEAAKLYFIFLLLSCITDFIWMIVYGNQV